MTPRYKPFDRFVLRSPFLPLSSIKDLSEEKIQSLYKNKEISTALYMASPELYAEMHKWLVGEKKASDNLIYSLMKYLIRMSSRCTPFGVFSGCSVGKVSSTPSSIKISNSSKHKKATRIDMNYLCALVHDIESDKNLRRLLVYYPNNSIYRLGDSIRYVEYQYRNSVRNHFIVSIDFSEYLHKIFEVTKTGKSIAYLIELLTNDGINNNDASDFIHELIDNQILVSNLYPNLSGIDYFKKIRNYLIEKSDNLKLIIFFKKVSLLIEQCNENNSLNKVLELQEILLDQQNNRQKKFLIQQDLYIHCDDININQKIYDELYKGLSALNKLTSFNESKNLHNFKKRFYERYETEEVSLSIAMDVETGIGYGRKNNFNSQISPLIDDLNLPTFQWDDPNYSNSVNNVDNVIFKKYEDTIKNNATELIFTDKDLQDLPEDWENLPDTLSVMTKLYKTGNEIPSIYLEFAGSTASRLIGRFSYLSEDIDSLVKEIYKKECQIKNNQILAEVIHLPESRTGNITHRKTVREYEIPYLAKSELPSHQVLEISDLYISYKYGKLILRSKKLNKEVIPILSNAHNYSYNALPIYNFLCDMQSQGLRRSVSYRWPSIFDGRSFLPRVSYRNIILSPAQWHITYKEVNNNNDIEQFRNFLKLKAVPEKFLYTQGDNELLFALNNDLDLKLLMNLLKSRGQMLLREFLFDEKNMMVKRNQEVFTNEVIFTFYKDDIK